MACLQASSGSSLPENGIAIFLANSGRMILHAERSKSC